jgi:amino-acid N-acetyltransferase
MNKPTFRPAIASDRAQIQQLLKDSKLPFEDVAEHLPSFVVAEEGQNMIGVAGLEIHGKAGLFRSVAVAESHRSKGIGSLLYNQIVSQAQKKGLREISLLTTTAEKFFLKKGFRKVEGDAIPQYVKSTKEYQIFCASTAVCMVKEM